MIAEVVHLTNHHHRIVAVVSGAVSWNIGMAVSSATDSSGLGMLGQLGVAGLIVTALLFMLRRSDAREERKDAATHDAESALVAELRAQNAELRQQLEQANSRHPSTRSRKDDK